MRKARFESLTSNGPIFPVKYEPKGYNANGEKLSPLAEEMAWKAARFIGSDYEAECFAPTSNMWKCFWPELTTIQQKLSQKDYMAMMSGMKATQEILKEEKKSLSKEEKLAIKAEKDALKEKHGVATLNGQPAPLCGYLIEDANWILTRGKDPRKFCWKYAVEEKDVVLNIVNEKSPANWKGEVKADPASIWAVKYQIKCGRPEMSCYKVLNKIIAFAPQVSVRQEMTTGKFDKSADILKNWDFLQKEIKKACLKGNDAALIVYLIQETGIRVGNERDESKMALTYGMSTLEGQHIKFSNYPLVNTVTFNFLGKDSVPETRSIIIDTEIWNILNNKKLYPGKRIFKVSSGDVNIFLKKLMPGISVKNLRTVKCNEVLVRNLKVQNVTKKNSEAEKLRAMFIANLEIAKTMNHQKNIGKTQKEGEGKCAERVAKAKARIKDMKKRHKDQLAKLDELAVKYRKAFAGMKFLKEKLAEIDEKRIKIGNQRSRAFLSIEKSELALEKKQLTAEISLGTSLQNYADFRIIKSFCEEIELPIEKIFTANQMKLVAPLTENTPVSYWRDYPNV